MKKLIVALALAVFSLTAFAADVAPVKAVDPVAVAVKAPVKKVVKAKKVKAVKVKADVAKK